MCVQLFLCTGSISYALHISLLISKLLCTPRAVWVGEGETPFPSHLPVLLQLQLCVGIAGMGMGGGRGSGTN